MGPVGYPKMLIRNYQVSRIFFGKPIGWREKLNFWVQWKDKFYPFYCCTVQTVFKNGMLYVQPDQVK